MQKYLPSWLRWGRGYWDTASTSSSFVSVSRPREQEDPEVEHMVTSILRIHTELSLLSDLRPCEGVNALFGELVGLCTRSVSEVVTVKVMRDPRIIEILPSIRHICARAESELESHWADVISGELNEVQDEASVYRRLLRFPYFDNYVDLTRVELAAVHAMDPTPIRRIAFIGSGPLPLTSLQLCNALTTITEVLNIDHEQTAIVKSRMLCARLGRRGMGMKFLCSDAGACDLREFDLVYLAALVGDEQEQKEKLLTKIVANMREGAIVVIRSSHGLRKVLYPEFDPTTDTVRSYLDVQLVTHPYNHVVNSVIAGRAKKRGKCQLETTF